MRGATAKLIPQCKVVSRASSLFILCIKNESREEPLEMHGNMYPRQMIVISTFVDETKFGLCAYENTPQREYFHVL
jgi:ribosomal protein L36